MASNYKIKTTLIVNYIFIYIIYKYIQLVILFLNRKKTT
ncbi:hypothetical protein PEPS_18430 [Persicobacter psychrovividus]|uniref:Uncharacterized protein n=1 Tax=Persicobacter psychrovividus TaxID=387638 RepID=A0ABM7VF58_9BACT|nr:hypothetical protein PEPS_18430 [Persicobacter psychrovividus]